MLPLELTAQKLLSILGILASFDFPYTLALIEEERDVGLGDVGVIIVVLTLRGEHLNQPIDLLIHLFGVNF